MLPPARPHGQTLHETAPPTDWEPSIQISEIMRDLSPSNHHVLPDILLQPGPCVSTTGAKVQTHMRVGGFYTREEVLEVYCINIMSKQANDSVLIG